MRRGIEEEVQDWRERKRDGGDSEEAIKEDVKDRICRRGEIGEGMEEGVD